MFPDELLQEISKSLGDLLSTKVLGKKSQIKRTWKQQLLSGADWTRKAGTERALSTPFLPQIFLCNSSFYNLHNLALSIKSNKETLQMKIELESIWKYSKNFQRYLIHVLSLKQTKTKNKQTKLGLNLSLYHHRTMLETVAGRNQKLIQPVAG